MFEGTLRWVENMNWKYSRDWLGAPRLPLIVDGIIEGYSRGYANLKFYWINRSGHMVSVISNIILCNFERFLWSINTIDVTVMPYMNNKTTLKYLFDR